MTFPLPDIPENHDAPCNICQRGWPYHAEACAYAATARDRDKLYDALRYIAGDDVAGYEAHMRPEEVARKALGRV